MDFCTGMVQLLQFVTCINICSFFLRKNFNVLKCNLTYEKEQVRSMILIKPLLWGILILLFPVTSGVLASVFSLNTVETHLLQGAFMYVAIVPPAVMVLMRKWEWKDIGFGSIDKRSCKRAKYFIPLLLLFVPVTVRGFQIESWEMVFSNLFLYLAVGIAEELYFRGMIPFYLEKDFSRSGVVCISTVIFGLEHSATALSGSNALETMLIVVNALLFGWMAMEIVILSGNILPTVLIHFLFDFETKVVAMKGAELFQAELLRGAMMFIMAVWLTVLVRKKEYAEQYRSCAAVYIRE